jgi:CubicO group peptidase (beta-lactamase class C family)
MNVTMKKKIETILNESMEKYDLPGLAIGVSIGDSFVCMGVKGYRNYVTKEPLSDGDIFHCASVSKTFTAMSTMKLVEEGRLNLEDRLVDLLPASIADGIEDRRIEQIRLKHMLSHTSGLGDVADYEWYRPALGDDALAVYAMSDEVQKQPMLWVPGTPYNENSGKGGFRYSNVAFELLGLIVARTAGCTYEEYVKQNLMIPAGMDNSTMMTLDRVANIPSKHPTEVEKFEEANRSGTASIALPHRRALDRSIVLEDYYPYNRAHAPSSTLTSNIEDLLKWGRANIKGILKPRTCNAMKEEYATVHNNGEKMGLGWFMRRQKVGDATYQLYGHEGTDDGFRASFWFCPEIEMVVAVQANITNSPTKRICKKLFEVAVMGR